MIVSFSVENFRSFGTEQTFSLVASNRFSGDHESHAVSIPRSKEKVLQASVLYGANGAGKSNLFKALRFFKHFITKPKKKGSGTGREPFLFGDQTRPSCFDLQFIVADRMYRLGFKLDDQKVTEEWFAEVRGAKERLIYERITELDSTVKIDAPGLKGAKIAALATVGGPPNQAFLAMINATLDERSYGADVAAVLGWIKHDLVLIAPNESFQALGHHFCEDGEFLKFAGDYLRAASTGVERLEVEKREITLEELSRLVPKNRLDRLLEDLNSDEGGRTSVVRISDGNEVLLEKSGENHFYRLTVRAMHQGSNQNLIPFELSQESDGTRRLLNLIPALQHLRTSSAVYFIDEIDRSMHPNLVTKFLEFFLKSCEGGQRQIIVTTHESNLLNLELLRRDELWFVEKDATGESHLHSLSDFGVRKDLLVRKHYLQGRFGAVPFLGELDTLMANERVCQ